MNKLDEKMQGSIFKGHFITRIIKSPNQTLHNKLAHYGFLFVGLGMFEDLFEGLDEGEFEVD